jgi:hypothetical protein
MKEQDHAISDDEFLLRRVHMQFFDSLNPPKIQPYAFKPTVEGIYVDDTGISLYRMACVRNCSDVLAKVELSKRHRYGVVGLSLSFLRSHKLDVVRDDDNLEPIVSEVGRFLQNRLVPFGEAVEINGAAVRTMAFS